MLELGKTELAKGLCDTQNSALVDLITGNCQVDTLGVMVDLWAIGLIAFGCSCIVVGVTLLRRRR